PQQRTRRDRSKVHVLPDDDGRIHPLTVAGGILRDTRERRLTVERVVDGDRPRLPIDAEPEDAAPHRALAARSLLLGQRTARLPQRFAQPASLAPIGG